MKEKLIENHILRWLNISGIYAWKNQSVGIFDPVKKIYRRSNNPFHIKGVSDILGILPDGKFLAIEVKSKTGKASPEQIMFIEKINKNGGKAFVAKTLEDVQEALKNVILILFIIYSQGCSSLINAKSSGLKIDQTSLVSVPNETKLVRTVSFIPDAKYTNPTDKAMIHSAEKKVNEVIKTRCFHDFMANRKMIQTKNLSSAEVADQISNLSGLIGVSMHFKRWTSAVAFREPNSLKINLNRKYFTASTKLCSWASTMAHEALGHALGNFEHSFYQTKDRDYSVPYSINAAFDACCK